MNEDSHTPPELPEPPLRAEPFSAAHMAAHGRRLAAQHVLGPRTGADWVLERLLENGAAIAAASTALARAAANGAGTDPAAAGLLDHHHLIGEQVRLAHHALLQPHSHALPHLQGAASAASRPRVYLLALEIVRHGDGRVDPESVARFIAAYQDGAPLTLGELQALPTMLRAALIENLRRLAARLTAPETGIDTRAQRAADRASLANSIDGLHQVAAFDWTAFLETASALEQMLRADPAGVYVRMDAATRAAYRDAVARLARQGGHAEAEVAAQALALARSGADTRTRHVGHYLVGAGLAQLQASLRAQHGALAPWRRLLSGQRPAPRLGAAAVLALLFTAALLIHAYRAGAGMALLLALGLLAAPGAGELGSALARQMARHLVASRRLPRLDFGSGIPPSARTMVTVMARLRSSQDAATLARTLEAHYLGNRDAQLRFCLLTDFDDAARETEEGDGVLLEAARAAIAALNQRHANAHGHPPFLLLHRPRVWSTGEAAWIGHARRHGQLADLNAFLRGAGRERFLLAEGKLDDLAAVRYVLALDPGTRLPFDGVRRMVAASAHPLNAPLLDAAGRRVVAGHGLLRPRLVPMPPEETATRYTRRCARLRHDLVGAGARGLQGIYEVDTWIRVLGQPLPEDALLAHGALAAGRLGGARLDDVVLEVPCPERYSDAVAARHRAMRGAWQLAARAPVGQRLAPGARWQLLETLRRSLLAPSLVSALVLCWALLPAPAFWSAAALAVFFLPAFCDMLVGLVDKPHDVVWRQHLDNWSRDARGALGQAVMDTAFLPHEAWFSLDAIVRANWRSRVSRSKLLAWRVPGMARSSADMEANWQSMWFAPLLAVGSAVLLTFLHPFALFAAAPLLLLWFLSPVLAWWISQPRGSRAPALAPRQTAFLAAVARRTWAYFETCVGPATNWLAPAAVQEHPAPQLVQTTTPGDIGYGLLANLAAWDFGFIAQAELLARTRAAFDSMALLQRQRGHFLAGYDSATLAPLLPARVSTTESGILAAHLLTLAGGLDALADTPIASARALDGMEATLQVLEAHARGGIVAPLAQCRAQLAALRAGRTDTLPDLADALRAAADAGACLLAAMPDAMADSADPLLRDWAARLEAQCAAAQADLLALAPWMRAAQEYVLDAGLTRIPTLRELARMTTNGADTPLAQKVAAGVACAQERLDDIADLAARARDFAAMDFGMLYQPDSGLLASGYDVAAERLDDTRCALLAHQARLASFVGIAQGQLPHRHWRLLARPLCIVDGEPLLLSERGALADYLAPQLVMPGYRDSLLDQACRGAVRVQLAHGRRHDLPWGMSRSACNTVDAALRYETRDFSVPGTGVHCTLDADYVVAPHAAMLALPVAPEAACANLERLAGLGALGEHGFYEALDFTSARLPCDARQAIVRSFAARHQGMGLLALGALLHGQPMARRFAADPHLAAALALLQERPPRSGAFEAPAFLREGARNTPVRKRAPLRAVRGVAPPQPQVQLLSNGRYHVMVTSDGGGYSAWDETPLTRWRADTAGIDGGVFCYLRDLDSGAVWSSAWQPTLGQPDHYEAVFPPGGALLRRREHGIEVVTEIAVAPADDVELRRLRLRNLGDKRRRIELTSYAELACAQAGFAPGRVPDFVHAEILPEHHALLCTRHPASDDSGPWLLQLLNVHGAADAASYETSRARFIGRAGDGVLPAALATPGPLCGATGPVHDAIAALRRVVTLDPGAELVVDLVLGAAATRAQALGLMDKYAQRSHADRVGELAWFQALALQRQLGVREADMPLYAGLAGAVLYGERALRADPALIVRNARGGAGLWMQAMSDDLPIVLLHVRKRSGLPLARQLVQAHAWWRLHGLAFDLVLWYGDEAGYDHALHEQLMALIAAQPGEQGLDRPGGIAVRAYVSLSSEDRTLQQAAARVVLVDAGGSLAEQLRRAAKPRTTLPPPRAQGAAMPPGAPPAPGALPPLLFDNGIGGFTPDGREYLIRTGPASAPPAAWTNVLANPGVGSIVAESGAACTWSGDAHGGRLTSWEDDPPAGRGGEAWYLRDEAGGQVWSPTALPAPSGGVYLARHGFGYSVFEHDAYGIHSEMTSFVAIDAPLKLTVLKLRNDGATARRIGVTGYVEWVLGATRARSGPHLVTGRDDASGALLAHTAWSEGFADRAAFFHVDADAAFTCDRLEFLGRAGSLARPAALERATLGGACGAALDPCAALQVVLDLAPGEERELVFQLGVAETHVVGDLVARHRGAQAGAALQRVHDHWRATLGAVQVHTPDPALDLLANGWLLYQVIACRLWACAAAGAPDGVVRCADSLQDAMATVHADPGLLRARLLDCAAHQYLEGDVQQWWRPPSQRGARTRCASDFLWLPLAACRYVRVTGDFAVLATPVPYLEGRALEPEEAICVDLPGQAREEGDLYEHCVRAIRHGLRVGTHGLPLVAGGDWLAEMDAIGTDGRGESVWLGFFLVEVLERFAPLAERRADYGFAITCRAAAQALATKLEEQGWNGLWYRRAYCDDGSVLGNVDGDACRIDAITQSWAVLSGVAAPDRASAALAALDAHLVRREARLVQLFDPPFGLEAPDPGRLLGWPAGVGANGGGDTQAALWAALAHARLGQGARAWELLDMVNPVRQGATPDDALRYALEPYVAAAGVDWGTPHAGRGRASWYTGAAGWMLRLIVETLLGLERVGASLVLAPLLPSDWPGFRIQYRYGATSYAIEVRAAEVPALLVDGQPVEGNTVQLVDDGAPHRVELHVGRRQDAARAATIEATQSKSMP